MSKSIPHIIREVYEAPVSELAYRAFSILSKREWIQRACHQNPNPSTILPAQEFAQRRRPMFFPSKANLSDWYKNNISTETVAQILAIAKSAQQGKIYCFSKAFLDFGCPIDWHLNPNTQKRWPTDKYWSSISLEGEKNGDVKLVWELNRFSQVYSLVRAYMLSGDSSMVSSFLSQLKSWEAENPYGYGVNWSSGQELAIRCLSWIYALYSFCEDSQFADEDIARIQRLLYSHAAHISANIGYSRYAVRNNHLIGEALALFVIGRLFPWFDRAGEWEKQGRQLLETDCIEQFYRDGGYCQSSHNYHRLALHYYIWAIRTAEVSGITLSAKVYAAVAKSAEYLCSFMDMKDGRLPNWGPNDGALLNPWTNCDYSDFRPVISSAYFLTKGKRLFGNGPWNEELLWFHGPKALVATQAEEKLKTASFGESGIHALRNGESSFASVRCGTVKNRFGHSDQLHVDLWVNEVNVAVDSGSYLYNDESQYHEHFMGTMSHNTVSLDGKSQMLLHRKFKWLYPAKAKLIAFTDSLFCGEHYGYKSLKGAPVHRRLCGFIGDDFKVSDLVFNQTAAGHDANLHWLIDCTKYVVKNFPSGCIIEIETNRGPYWISVLSSVPGKVSFVKGAETGEGWLSRYYSVKTPVLSVNYCSKYTENCRFETLFSDTEVRAQEHQKNAHLINSPDFCHP